MNKYIFNVDTLVVVKVTLYFFCLKDGNDFTAFNDLQLTLFVGETRVCETLGITQDDGVEGEEILELTIASSTLRLGSPSEIAITILDSDSKFSL